MPPLLTQVARLSDGMPLVATITANPGVPVSSKQQQEAKDIMRSVTHQYVPLLFPIVVQLNSLLIPVANSTLLLRTLPADLLVNCRLFPVKIYSTIWSEIRCAT
jgi:hypothetical protein